MLVYHAHTQGDGVLGAEMGNLFAADVYLPVGGLVDAVEYVHQRGLAGSVFPYQGEYLPPADVKGDVVIGQNAGELHADVPELYCKFLQSDPSRSSISQIRSVA